MKNTLERINKLEQTIEQGTRELQELKAQYLEDLKKSKVEFYEVHQNTEFGSDKNILFKDAKQALSMNSAGHYIVEALNYEGRYVNHSSNFVWIPIARKDIKKGDVIYATNSYDKELVCLACAKLVLEDEALRYLYIEGNDSPRTDYNVNWEYYYKLVDREEV